MSKLSDHFPPLPFNEWRSLAEKELSKVPQRNWEGVTLSGYYNQENRITSAGSFANSPGHAENGSGDVRSWDNISVISDSEVKRANGHVLNALMNGADGVLFSNSCNFDPDALLADVLPDYAALNFKEADPDFVTTYRAWLDHQDADHRMVRGYIHCTNVEANELDGFFKLFKDFSGIRFLHLHLPEADQDEMTSQLAIFLRDLTLHIEKIADQGTGIKDIWKRLSVSMEIGPLFFEEIARQRAIRILCFKVLSAFGLQGHNPSDLWIHALSPAWNKEFLQPHANMLKGCTAGMAGILGGCTQLSISPEDPESELQQRIARNVPLILKKECYMDKVSDPVAGTYYVETLTDNLARNAWNKFITETDNQ